MKLIMELLRLIWRFFIIRPKNVILRLLGARIGKNCHLFNSLRDYDLKAVKYLTLGDNVTIARRTVIFTHDALAAKFGINKDKPRNVEIGDNVFIGAACIILPGVKINKNAIIGAGSIVTKEIPENSIAAGNPARVIRYWR
jgi:maltose O-acetyltransferase